MIQRISKVSAASLFLSAQLALAALCAGASAQQLLPPAATGSWTPQLAQSAEPLQAQPAPPDEAPAPPASAPAPAPSASAPAPAPEAPKPIAPDFSIVDRALGLESVPLMESWTTELDEIEQVLNAGTTSGSQLRAFRERLDAVRGSIGTFVEALNPRIEAAKAQVDNLGPAPEGGEPEAVATQRAELQQAFGSLSAARNIAESTRLRSSQLTETVQNIRRQRFTGRLFERVPEAHDSYTWLSAPSHLSFALQKAGQTISGWWQHSDRQSDILQTIIAALLIAIGTAFVSRRGVRHFRAWDELGEPPFWRRSTSAAWVILLRALPFVATTVVLYYGLRAQQLMPDDVDRLAYSAMRSTLIIATVCALVTTALAPLRPHWRLLPMSDKAASRIRWLVVALATVYSITLLLGTIRFVSNAPFALTVAQGSVSTIIIALLVIAILRTPRDAPVAEGATADFDWVGMLRIPLWGMALVILATALTGYIGLARFLSAQLIVTGTILTVVYLLLIWVDAFGQSMGDENARVGKWLKEKAGFEQLRREQLALPVTLLLKFVVLIGSMPFVLLQWGFDWKDVREWGSALFFGFTVGGTTISIAAIMAAVIVFGIGYLVARLFQNWLDGQVLAPAGISGGARHSIRTGVGYLGVILAGLFAVSYAGLDLSNIALIAGALSVGIGLGLQGVVNNFVSGLILLVERPIKVGDWVVVGGEEGTVRKISVRSTEIETFDRANVLIPNSYFISEKVKNWTLHNYSGRVVIPVGVDYNSDPRKVKDILLKIAQAHPQVMTTPAPFVYFEDFGADALNFKLYVYVYDITKSLSLRTDLRIDIFEALRSEAIQIPFRQTDVHLQGLDWLKSALMPLAQHARNGDGQSSRQMRTQRSRRAAHGKAEAENSGKGKNGNGNGGSRGTEHAASSRAARSRSELS